MDHVAIGVVGIVFGVQSRLYPTNDIHNEHLTVIRYDINADRRAALDFCAEEDLKTAEVRNYDTHRHDIYNKGAKFVCISLLQKKNIKVTYT